MLSVMLMARDTIIHIICCATQFKGITGCIGWRVLLGFPSKNAVWIDLKSNLPALNFAIGKTDAAAVHIRPVRVVQVVCHLSRQVKGRQQVRALPVAGDL
jgi:hypothetical protein